MTPRQMVAEITNLRAACEAFRFAAVRAESDDAMVKVMREWLAADSAAKLLADEAAAERLAA